MTERIRQPSSEGQHCVLVTESVLFPAARLTFHITDPEQRALIRRSLMEDGYLLVRPKDESFESSVATLACVLDYTQLSPQRVAVTLGGVARVRINAVYPSAGQATARWARLADEIDNEKSCRSLANVILRALKCLAADGVSLAEEAARVAADAGDPASIADVVGSVTFERPAEKVAHLAQTDVQARLCAVLEHLLEIATRE